MIEDPKHLPSEAREGGADSPRRRKMSVDRGLASTRPAAERQAHRPWHGGSRRQGRAVHDQPVMPRTAQLASELRLHVLDGLHVRANALSSKAGSAACTAGTTPSSAASVGWGAAPVLV